MLADVPELLGDMVGQQGQSTTQFDEPIHEKWRLNIWLVIWCIYQYLKHFFAQIKFISNRKHILAHIETYYIASKAFGIETA